MMGVWIGALQNMYPELGAGVEEHSILLREPLQRVARSVYPIMGVVYDGERAAQTGRTDQGLPHHDQGRRRQRQALSRAEPRDVLLGARHVLHADHQGGRILLRRADRGREAPAVRRARAVVPDVRHEHAAGARRPGRNSRSTGSASAASELEINRATLDIFSIRIPKPWFVLMPTPIWDQLFKPMVAGQRWIAAGTVRPGGAREGRHALDTAVTKCCCGCSASWSKWRSSWCPTRSGCTHARWPPTAARPDDVPDDAPLVEAPAFMAPPRDRRDLPMHYVPRRKTLLDRAGSLVHTTFSLAGLRPARGRSTAA